MELELKGGVANAGAVARVDSTPHELATMSDRVVKRTDDPGTFLAAEPVVISDQPQSRREIIAVPPEPCAVLLVVDWHTHAGETRQVVHRPTRRREVEVQQGDRLAIAKDNVLQAHIVVTDDGAALGIGYLVAPRSAPRHDKGADSAMEATHQSDD